MKRTRAEISAIMQRVQSRGTAPELHLETALRKLKLNFTTHRPDLPGRPDFAFDLEHLAIFVDGDFWHGHQWKLRGLRNVTAQFKTSRNKNYWVKKIGRTIARDKSNSRRLRRLGWSVIRIWESDLKKRPDACLRKVVRSLQRVR